MLCAKVDGTLLATFKVTLKNVVSYLWTRCIVFSDNNTLSRHLLVRACVCVCVHLSWLGVTKHKSFFTFFDI